MPNDTLPVSPSSELDTSTPWTRRGSQASRMSNRPSRSRRSALFVQQLWKNYLAFGEQIVRTYKRLSPVQQALAIGSCVLLWVILILGLIYSHTILEWLAPITKTWRDKPWGWMLLFFMVFASSIPPLIGYSTMSMLCGVVYGFPLGWPIAAAGCTLGSLCAFIASRTVLSSYVDRMVGKDPRFRALAQVLRKEGILYLTAIRFCPLPFSLSNGFLATIPSITPFSFTLSTFLSSPKLLVHIFIGSRLAILVEKGEDMSIGDKMVNWLSIIIGAGVGIFVGLIIYRRTMARAAEIAREEARDANTEEGEAGYEDADGTLMDPEDAAALMSDDDMSMWDTQVESAYRDDEGSSDGDSQKKKTKKQDIEEDDPPNWGETSDRK